MGVTYFVVVLVRCEAIVLLGFFFSSKRIDMVLRMILTLRGCCAAPFEAWNALVNGSGLLEE